MRVIKLAGVIISVYVLWRQDLMGVIKLTGGVIMDGRPQNDFIAPQAFC